MKTIAMSGASGFAGTSLRVAFDMEGWKVIPLERKDFEGNPEGLARRIEGSSVIINLAGAPVIKRWTDEYKTVMRESRVGVTRKLIEAMKLLEKKPDVFISTSAVGYYSDEGEQSERHYKKADTFLGHLSENWEREARKAEPLGIRTVIFRVGIILGKNGGALSRMMLPFKLFLGGKIGNGKQHVSWVHIDDLVRAYSIAIKDTSFAGIYNLTAPKPTTNRGLTRALSRAIGRPAILPIPKFILRLRFGEGAQLLTGGQQVFPERLLEHGFSFRFIDIGDAVRDCVK
jgi:uncharacterized protein (TIGR01777 family)